MRVTNLPRDDKTNGWYEILPDHGAPNVLTGDQQADWVVVGAGFAGLGAARRLGELRPNDKVALVEAQRIGRNASGRNSGFIIDLPHNIEMDDPERDFRQMRLNRTAIAWLSDIVQNHQIQCQWSVRGKVHAAATANGVVALDAYCQGLDMLGESYERWNAERATQYLGTAHFHDAVWTPENILMQPAALVRGLAATMPENVTVYEDSPVEAFDKGPTKTLTTAHGSLKTPHVILATNGWTPAFGYFTNHFIVIFTYASLTRPLTEAEQADLGGEGDWGVIPATMGGTTMRYTQDKRLLIRKGVRYTPDCYSHDAQRRGVYRGHIKTFRERFPMLPDVTFEHSWGGAMCMTRNHAPKFGVLDDGVWSAVCQNGVGAAKGTIQGRAVAELAVGEDSEIVSDMLKFDEPVRLPPRWLTGIGARLEIAKAELFAGRDS